MKHTDRLVVAGVIVWLVVVSVRQAMLIDRTDDINDVIKTLAGATIDIKQRCDVVGEMLNDMGD